MKQPLLVFVFVFVFVIRSVFKLSPRRNVKLSCIQVYTVMLYIVPRSSVISRLGWNEIRVKIKQMNDNGERCARLPSTWSTCWEGQRLTSLFPPLFLLHFASNTGHTFVNSPETRSLDCSKLSSALTLRGIFIASPRFFAYKRVQVSSPWFLSTIRVNDNIQPADYDTYARHCGYILLSIHGSRRIG